MIDPETAQFAIGAIASLVAMFLFFKFIKDVDGK